MHQIADAMHVEDHKILAVTVDRARELTDHRPCSVRRWKGSCRASAPITSPPGEGSHSPTAPARRAASATETGVVVVDAAGVSCGAGAAGASSGGGTTCRVTTFGVTITRGNRSSNCVAGWSFAGPDLIAI